MLDQSLTPLLKRLKKHYRTQETECVMWDTSLSHSTAGLWAHIIKPTLQTPPSAPASCSASLESPPLYDIPNSHCRLHKSPTLTLPRVQCHILYPNIWFISIYFCGVARQCACRNVVFNAPNVHQRWWNATDRRKQKLSEKNPSHGNSVHHKSHVAYTGTDPGSSWLEAMD